MQFWQGRDGMKDKMENKNKNKKYDLILYGASGFTGRQMFEYLAFNASSSLRWAISGRNEAKLEETRRTISSLPGQAKVMDIAILPADSNDKVAIDQLVSSTKVVLTSAGPYSIFGKQLLASCAEQGVDYLDITGETAFISDMIGSHGTIAEQSGAKIIPFCGFDSVPSDLGVYALSKSMKEKFNEPLQSAKGIFSVQGGFNGGTLLSMIAMLESGDWKRMSEPGLLLPKGNNSVLLVPDSFEVSFEPTLQRWLAPFVMAMINTRVVNRSAALMEKFGNPYSQNFSYTEHHGLGNAWNPIPAFLLANGFKTFQQLGQWSGFRELLKKFGPKPNEGPSEESRRNGYYHLDIVGKSPSGKEIILTFAGKGDPGNQATVLFACESALAVALERGNLPGGHRRVGFLTPSTGLGDVLLERLKQKNVEIRSTDLS